MEQAEASQATPPPSEGAADPLRAQEELEEHTSQQGEQDSEVSSGPPPLVSASSTELERTPRGVVSRLRVGACATLEVASMGCAPE